LIPVAAAIACQSSISLSGAIIAETECLAPGPGASVKVCQQRLVTAIFALCLAPYAFCLDPALSLTQYTHTGWTKTENSPLPPLKSLAQTDDGFLWLGTTQGLYRFDGLRFTAWTALPGEALPGKAIESLTPSAAGGLWIGTSGGISRLHKGHLVNYNASSGVPDGPIVALSEDRSGRLWAGNVRSRTSGLLLLDHGAVTAFGVSDGLPTPQVISLFQERAGILWVGTLGGFCRFENNPTRHCVVENAQSAQLAGFKTIAGSLRNTGSSIKSVLRDRDGALWFGTLGQGLYRASGDHIEQFTRRDGLSSDVVEALTEDREGNLWIGTANGLDRLSEPKVARWSTVEGLSGNVITAVCATRDGDIWIATFGRGIDRLHGNRITTYSKDAGLPSSTVLSLFEDVRGRLWVGTARGVAYLSGSRFLPVSSTGDTRYTYVGSMTSGPTGEVWLADGGSGLARIRNGRIEKWEPTGLATEKIYQIRTARNGDLWIGYSKGGVAVLRGESVQTFSTRDGLAAGRVQAIYEDSAGSIWVATLEGLSRFRNGRWTSWDSRHGIPSGGVQTLIEDDCGHLWLVTRTGMLLLQREALNRMPDGSPSALSFMTYGPSDGIRMAETGGIANPRITKSGDGRLWVSTPDGVASVNPASIRTNVVPPPVSIEQLTVDGVPMDVTSPRIRFRGRSVQIEYTALSLTSPESVRFKHKLDGVEQGWVSAGTRRQIVYANLPPGDYTFHVLASNNDGVWNQEGASLAFRREPYFYQTWLFFALCLALMAASVYGGHRLRMGQLRSRFKLVLAERARLTREMHDTLLQGFAGVVFQLDAAARQASTSPEQSQQRIGRALEQADQSLREAREALSCIRLSALENSTLQEALLSTGKQILDGTAIRFQLEVSGKVRQLPYDVEANLFIIAREAIHNALNHAGPQRVDVELAFSRESVRLTVQDDGVGFDPGNTTKRQNHWGLSGMHERARQIGGTLTIDSEPNRGTRILLVVGRPVWRGLRPRPPIGTE